ncbi:hypothetical protein OUZ56_014545 [Daphnia magna]|uniref:Uncharacterized protein n=1 Tax=Daphnia magna TaxID=35525 RepID=A0ABR0AK56_9CRUS|nr:hypothetical protein OUZ56_014545 [Daphnia magna]
MRNFLGMNLFYSIRPYTHAIVPLPVLNSREPFIFRQFLQCAVLPVASLICSLISLIQSEPIKWRRKQLAWLGLNLSHILKRIKNPAIVLALA